MRGRLVGWLGDLGLCVLDWWLLMSLRLRSLLVDYMGRRLLGLLIDYLNPVLLNLLGAPVVALYGAEHQQAHRIVAEHALAGVLSLGAATRSQHQCCKKYQNPVHVLPLSPGLVLVEVSPGVAQYA